MSPDRSDVAITLAAIALVPAIFGAYVPKIADVREGQDQGGHVAHGIACATLTAAGLLLAVAVGARSWPVAVYGGAAVATFAATYAIAREHA
jgi:hypothetical protein